MATGMQLAPEADECAGGLVCWWVGVLVVAGPARSEDGGLTPAARRADAGPALRPQAGLKSSKESRNPLGQWRCRRCTGFGCWIPARCWESAVLGAPGGQDGGRVELAGGGCLAWAQGDGGNEPRDQFASLFGRGGTPGVPGEDEAGVLQALLSQPHDQLVELLDGAADERAVWLLTDGADVASLIGVPAHRGRQRRIAGAADDQARQKLCHCTALLAPVEWREEPTRNPAWRTNVRCV
jgi:hypothetical protein